MLTKFNFSHYHTGLRNPGTPVPLMETRYILVLWEMPGHSWWCLVTLGVNFWPKSNFFLVLGPEKVRSPKKGHNSLISGSTLIGTHCIFINFVLPLKSGIYIHSLYLVHIYSVFCFNTVGWYLMFITYCLYLVFSCSNLFILQSKTSSWIIEQNVM